MNLAFVQALIATPGAATTNALFKQRHPGIFWVDWREADDDIVRLAAEALGRDDLSAQWVDERFYIDFQGRRTAVPLECKPGEQDLTLAALNRALDPGYELRWIRASDGGDTLAFQILPRAAWQALQAHYGERVDAAFAPIDPDRPLFGAADQPPGVKERLAVAASLGAGSPAAALCAAVRFRLLPSHSPLLARSDAPPVYTSVAGDLCLAFEGVDGGVPRLLTATDLHAAGQHPHSLQAQAIRNHAPEWTRLADSGNGVVSRFHTDDGVDTSSLLLHPGLWAHYAEKGYRSVVAVPRRDLLLWCDATDAVAVAALGELAQAFDPGASDTLSRQLYTWQAGRWQVRTPEAHERAFRDLPLWQAAERGEVRAQYQVASLYDTATHYAEAVRRYQRIAEQIKATPVDSGDMFENGSAALCNLADKYEHGKGVAQDLKLARQGYMRSAAMGNCVAQYSLGMMYAAGRGVPRDPELAATWLHKSAQQGYEPAARALPGLGVHGMSLR